MTLNFRFGSLNEEWYMYLPLLFWRRTPTRDEGLKAIKSDCPHAKAARDREEQENERVRMAREEATRNVPQGSQFDIELGELLASTSGAQNVPERSAPLPTLLNPSGLPDVFQAIFHAADRETLFKLRPVCSYFCDMANALLVRRVLFHKPVTTINHNVCPNCGSHGCPYPPIPIGVRVFGLADTYAHSPTLVHAAPERLPLWINIHHENDNDILLFGNRPVKKGAVDIFDYPISPSYYLPWWVIDMRPRMIRARPLPGHCDNLEQTCVSIRCEVFVGRAPIPRPGPFMPKQVQAERVVIVLDSSFWGYLQSAAELWLHHFDQAEEIVLIFKDQWADNNMGVRSFFARALSYYITSPDPDSNQIIGRLKMVNFDLNPLIEVDPEIRFPPVTLPMRMLLQAELTNVPANFPLLRGALPGSVDNITFLTLQEYREEVGLDQFTLEYEV